MSEPGGYDELLALLAGPADFWDRPAGDWPVRGGGGEGFQREVSEARQDANAAYRLGTKALRRRDLDGAEAWFAVACEQQHPGAAFRAALTRVLAMAPPASGVVGQVQGGKSFRLVSHLGSGKTHAFISLAWAARWGHGDAQHLIGRLRTDAGEPVEVGWPLGEEAADTDDGILRDGASVVLMADNALYEPQDTEFYPLAQKLLELRCAPHQPSPPPLTRPAGPQAVSEQQSFAPARRLLGIDLGQDVRGYEDLPTGDGVRPLWPSVAGNGLGHDVMSWGDLQCNGLVDPFDAPLTIAMLGIPVLVWRRKGSCSCEEEGAPEAFGVSQPHCRCASELRPFTTALTEALETEQTRLSRFVSATQRLRETAENRPSADRNHLGTHLALLWDDPSELSAGAPVPVAVCRSDPHPAQIADFTHPTLQPCWRRRTRNGRVLSLDADLGGGLSLYDLVATDVDPLAHTVGGVFEDEGLNGVLRCLDPAERQVVFARAQGEGTSWTEAAAAVGAPDGFGERVRRKVKRLAAEQRRRTAQRRTMNGAPGFQDSFLVAAPSGTEG
ncbi:hypothetical protein [Streptomyces sp. NPDC056468]|uniref:VMAP-C domain-containing protein n=1 Tax=Streptomyces sp. NPDC056468 TaxID=3345830 RepID=UPI0036C495DD